LSLCACSLRQAFQHFDSLPTVVATHPPAHDPHAAHHGPPDKRPTATATLSAICASLHTGCRLVDELPVAPVAPSHKSTLQLYGLTLLPRARMRCRRRGHAHAHAPVMRCRLPNAQWVMLQPSN
jgi:hypothetical protein